MISQKLSLYQIFVRYFAIGLPISQIVELFVSKQATSSKPSHCSHNLTSLCKQKQPAKKNNSKVDSQMRQSYLIIASKNAVYVQINVHPKPHEICTFCPFFLHFFISHFFAAQGAHQVGRPPSPHWQCGLCSPTTLCSPTSVGPQSTRRPGPEYVPTTYEGLE